MFFIKIHSYAPSHQTLSITSKKLISKTQILTLSKNNVDVDVPIKIKTVTPSNINENDKILYRTNSKYWSRKMLARSMIRRRNFFAFEEFCNSSYITWTRGHKYGDQNTNQCWKTNDLSSSIQMKLLRNLQISQTLFCQATKPSSSQNNPKQLAKYLVKGIMQPDFVKQKKMDCAICKRLKTTQPKSQDKPSGGLYAMLKRLFFNPNRSTAKKSDNVGTKQQNQKQIPVQCTAGEIKRSNCSDQKVIKCSGGRNDEKHDQPTTPKSKVCNADGEKKTESVLGQPNCGISDKLEPSKSGCGTAKGGEKRPCVEGKKLNFPCRDTNNKQTEEEMKVSNLCDSPKSRSIGSSCKDSKEKQAKSVLEVSKCSGGRHDEKHDQPTTPKSKVCNADGEKKTESALSRDQKGLRHPRCGVKGKLEPSKSGCDAAKGDNRGVSNLCDSPKPQSVESFCKALKEKQAKPVPGAKIETITPKPTKLAGPKPTDRSKQQLQKSDQSQVSKSSCNEAPKDVSGPCTKTGGTRTSTKLESGPKDVLCGKNKKAAPTANEIFRDIHSKLSEICDQLASQIEGGPPRTHSPPKHPQPIKPTLDCESKKQAPCSFPKSGQAKSWGSEAEKLCKEIYDKLLKLCETSQSISCEKKSSSPNKSSLECRPKHESKHCDAAQNIIQPKIKTSSLCNNKKGPIPTKKDAVEQLKADLKKPLCSKAGDEKVQCSKHETAEKCPQTKQKPCSKQSATSTKQLDGTSRKSIGQALKNLQNKLLGGIGRKEKLRQSSSEEKYNCVKARAAVDSKAKSRCPQEVSKGYKTVTGDSKKSCENAKNGQDKQLDQKKIDDCIKACRLGIGDKSDNKKSRSCSK